MKKLLLVVAVLFFTTSIKAQWQPTSGPPGGIIHSLVTDGTNMFAGTYVGVFLSVNNGLSWTAVNNGLTTTDIRALAISGTTIFAGSLGGGMFISIDNGSTWTTANTGLTNNSIQTIAISGSNIFAGTNNGMFLSINNGGNWTAINTGLTATCVNAIAIDGTNIFAGTSGVGGGVYLSTNNGGLWAPRNTGLPSNSTVLSVVASGNNIYAGTTSGLYFSTNSGTNWTADPVNASNSNVSSLLIVGTNVFAGTSNKGVYLATSIGGPWTQVSTGLISNTGVNALASVGTDVFAATTYGMYFTANNGGLWSDINVGLGTARISALASDGTNLFAGTPYGRGLFLTTDDGNSWNTSHTGLPLPAQYVQVHSVATNGSTVFAAIDFDVYISTNNGNNWSQVSNGLPNATIQSLAFSGTDIFAGTNDGVYLSTNNGGLWTASSTGLPVSTQVNNILVNGSAIFLGTPNGAYLSTNNGGLWTQINNGLTTTGITSLACIGSNVFAATGGGVFLTTNNGGLWTSVNTGLTNLGCASLAASGTNLFVGTFNAGGIFVSTNNGSLWTSVDTGMLLYNAAYELIAHGQNLYAGTMYGGVWSRPLSQMIAIPVWPGDADNNHIVNNSDLLPIGLHYAQTGTPRSSISNAWAANGSSDWGIFQANGADIKHADCDGDGVINNNDTLAINLNFNLAHARIVNPGSDLNENVRIQSTPEIYFVIPGGPFIAGSLVDVEVWVGDATTPVNNLYGISFDIEYDASLVQPGTESITYPASWLGTPGIDAVKISKINAPANVAYGAETRIDHIDATGYGKIADFKFQVSTSLVGAYYMNFNIIGYEANDAAGGTQLFITSSDSIGINQVTTGVQAGNVNQFIVSPNPLTEQTTISFNKVQVNTTIRIVDVLGKEINVIRFSGKQLLLDKAEMLSGVYFLQIIDENENVTTTKIIVQ